MDWICSLDLSAMLNSELCLCLGSGDDCGHGAEGKGWILYIVFSCSSAEGKLSLSWKPTHNLLCALLIVYLLLYIAGRNSLIAGFCLVWPFINVQ